MTRRDAHCVVDMHGECGRACQGRRPLQLGALAAGGGEPVEEARHVALIGVGDLAAHLRRAVGAQLQVEVRVDVDGRPPRRADDAHVQQVRPRMAVEGFERHLRPAAQVHLHHCPLIASSHFTLTLHTASAAAQLRFAHR